MLFLFGICNSLNFKEVYSVCFISNKGHKQYQDARDSFRFWKDKFFGMNTNSFWNYFKCYATTVFRDCAIFKLFFFQCHGFFFDGQFILRHCRLCVFILARLHFFVSRSKDACSVKLSEWSNQQIILKWLKRYRHYTLS